jgi:demethylmenaquinone methyltransferase/2-methoxy-6-polyprenyl-1,4-benzoquinol methylase
MTKNNSDTQTFFNKYSSSWDDDVEARQPARIETIFKEKLSFIRPPFLDLGSGTGVLLPILKKYNKQNREIFELDIATKMLQKARQKASDLSNTHFIMADAHHLPLSTNYFNTVLCFQVYPHFHDKKKATSEIYNSLKINGYLIILHLMGHKELNKLHRKAGREVADDRILPVDKLAQLIKNEKFNIIHTEEKSDIYLIIAQK